jgi:chromate transporter
MILGQAAFNQAKKATPGRKEKALAAATCVLLLVLPAWGSPVYVLALGAVASCLFWPAPQRVEQAGGRRMKPLEMLLCFAPIGLAVFQIVPALLPDELVAKIGLAFAGMGTTLFGGGLVMVPLLEGLIVGKLGWLDHAGFSAGLAASQLTPGPILSIATFTGMQAAGLGGALAATLGIYLPTALIALGANGVADRLKGSRLLQHAMIGVRCSVVGLIAGAAISLLLKMPFHTNAWQSVALACAAWLIVWRFKQPPYVSLPIGALLAWFLI